MAYNELLADRIRNKLKELSLKNVTEKKMFGGLAFMVNGKMCINVSGENLMCRFDPELEETVRKKKGYLPMIMKGKIYKGYCYVENTGFKTDADFDNWLSLCLDFNQQAKSSKHT